MSFLAKQLTRRVLAPVVSAVKILNFSTTSAALVPKVQQPAPNFEATAVVNGEFNKLKLADFHGKYVVLMFYPLDFTFVCPTELIAFSDRAKDFASIDCQIIGVSTDSEFSHLAWTNTPRKDGGLGKIEIPLLADYQKKISQDYNVLLDAGFALRAKTPQTNPGVICFVCGEAGHVVTACPKRWKKKEDPPSSNTSKQVNLCSRAARGVLEISGLFVIDRNGILRHMSVNDLPVGRSVDETLRLVKAFQFADKHGEVCPANWNPDTNAHTIKPSPQESKEYFRKAHKSQ